jgi:2-dehydro-3-deoxyglucarate aldolase
MNKLKALNNLRKKLNSGKHTIGTWMQIPHPSIAEILGASNFDWIAVDMEHGSISVNQLPDIFRAIELSDTLPFVRVIEGSIKEFKQVLDAGAAGIIIPKVETKEQLIDFCLNSRWPPSGERGVGFSRANLFGEDFDKYKSIAQKPYIVAMIESKLGFSNLESIIEVKGLDAILIGPYDLSASFGMIADFENKKFISIIDRIKSIAKTNNINLGIHIIEPQMELVKKAIDDGFTFIPYSIDAVFLAKNSKNIL